MEKKSKALKSDKKNNPSTYTQDLGEWICEIVATHPISLNKLHEKYKTEGFPSADAIVHWRYRHPEFREMFLDAKKFQSELYIEETYDIADNMIRDTIMTDKGEVANSVAVSRDKLRIDIRKFHVGKLLPKIYGEKTYTETTVKVLTHEEALQELE